MTTRLERSLARLLAGLNLCLLLAFAGACSQELRVLEPNPAQPEGDAGDALSDAGDGAIEAPDDAGSETPSLPSLSAFEHTCEVRQGTLLCWGDNAFAQLGTGDRTAGSVPQVVASQRDFIQVCAGEAHSCALRGTGELSCWGENLHGELGLGDTRPRETPSVLEGRSFSFVACGGSVTCALGLTGALFCWGDNFEGQLGQNDPFQSPGSFRPLSVATDQSFREVSVGQGHVCAVTRQGELYCWGRNTTGQLGIPDAPEQLRTPTRVESALRFQSVSAGQSHSCAIARDSGLYCWGTDLMGSLGQGLADGDRVPTPTQVGSDLNYSQVHASWFHSCALHDDGTLFCWGRNTEGQLGLGDTENRNTPARVGSGADWRGLTTGRFHTCGVQGVDTFCWGENDARHQLGLGPEPGRRDTPTQIASPLTQP